MKFVGLAYVQGSGYRVLDAPGENGESGRFIAEKSPHRPGYYDPFERNDGAFYEIAKSDTSEEATLRLVHRYGNLGAEELMPERKLYETNVKEWVGFISRTRTIVELWEGVRNADEKLLRKHVT